MSANLSSTFSLTPVDEDVVLITRMFDAPRDRIFAAMSSCEHLKHWLGPRYLTMTYCDMDFRTGGHYRYILSRPDGTEAAFRGSFRAVEPPSRIVQTFEFEGMPGHIAEETLVLEELGGQTRLSIRARYETPGDRDAIITSGMLEGARDSYDQLEEYLTAA